MFKVTVQVKKLSSDWNDSEKIEHTFENWDAVSTFAYRLAVQTEREIRVESHGNGYYYIPQHADNFLSSKK